MLTKLAVAALRNLLEQGVYVALFAGDAVSIELTPIVDL